MDHLHIRQYRLTDLLGTGRHGETWLAIDEALQRPVVLKFLPSALVTDAEFRQGFLGAMKRLNALKHRSIAAFFTIDTETDRPFIVREYAAGVPLRAHTRGEPVFYSEFLGVALQLAGVLQAAHVEDVALGNISPDNIIVDDDLRMVLVDSCLPWGGDQDESDAAVVGSCRYRSPEQLSGELPTPASDMFSLGAVFFELLTGEPAFEGNTLAAIRTAVMSIPVSFQSMAAQRVPPEARLLIERMCAPDPADRLSALSLVASLQEMREQHTREVVDRPSDDEPPSGNPRRVLVLSAIAVILVIIWFLMTYRGY